MLEIKQKINDLEFRKWVVIPYLFLAFFGSLGDQEVLQGPPLQSGIHTIDPDQGASEKILVADRSSSHNILEFVEIELDENDNDHHYLNREISQPPSPLLLTNKTTRAFLFPPKRKIKLFILYLSWKSFLHL